MWVCIPYKSKFPARLSAFRFRALPPPPRCQNAVFGSPFAGEPRLYVVRSLSWPPPPPAPGATGHAHCSARPTGSAATTRAQGDVERMSGSRHYSTSAPNQYMLRADSSFAVSPLSTGCDQPFRIAKFTSYETWCWEWLFCEISMPQD